LDAFVQYRQSLGLPASVLDIGCMEEVGYVSQNVAILEGCRSAAMHMLTERDLLESLQLMIERSVPPPQSETNMPVTSYMNFNQVAIGLASTLSLSDPTNRCIWKRDPRMAVYHNIEKTSSMPLSDADEGLRHFLAAVAGDPVKLQLQASADFLAHEIGIHVYNFLMKPEEELDVSLTLTAVGVDSLIAIEIRNWWRQNLGSEVTVLELLNGGSIKHLGGLAVLKLKDKFELASGEIKGDSEVRATGDTYLLNKAL
jgi:aryl carrier-like protein